MDRKNDYSVKPYNRCLSCPHRKVRCDGPRTSGLALERWWEYMRDLKALNGLTNAYIAEAAELSVKTVEKVLGPTPPESDIMRDTARRIENAIIGATSQYPCYLAFEEENMPDAQKLNAAQLELKRMLEDNQEYRVALENIHSSYKAEMDAIRTAYQNEIDTIRADAKKQVDYLNGQRIMEEQEAQKKIDFLNEQVARLQRDNDNLWAENNRKSKVVDMFLEKQNVLLEKKPDSTS